MVVALDGGGLDRTWNRLVGMSFPFISRHRGRGKRSRGIVILSRSVMARFVRPELCILRIRRM